MTMKGANLQKSCGGYCVRCDTEHFLDQDLAQRHCLELMEELQTKKRIDLLTADHEADPHFSTEYLFGAARGQMFGVMVCCRTDGSTTLLRAFSGQYDGRWTVPGWAPPLFDVAAFDTINTPEEKKIKELGRQMDLLPNDVEQRKALKNERKTRSQQLMKDIHDLYELTNFRNETRPLQEVFLGNNGIPTGTGDCCAPKLFNHAAKNSLIPLGVAEFYWGRENRSSTRQHGYFYPSCAGKCRPILGFMLCGLENIRAK